MNYTQQYAEVLTRANMEKAGSDFDIFFDSFMAVLKQKNHLALLPAIHTAVVSMLQHKQQSDRTTLTVADMHTLDAIRTQAQQHSGMFGTDFVIKEDPNIIGGYVLQNQTSMIDSSFKTKLLQIYKQLVQ